MTERIDVFAHVLPPKFYQSMLKIDPQIPQKFPFINIKSLSDILIRKILLMVSRQLTYADRLITK